MRDFVLFFGEKEGTSAMVRWADRLEGVSVVHHDNGRGWEPLEAHLLGRDLRLEEVSTLFSLIYSKPRDMDALRRTYAVKRPDRTLVSLPETGSVGLKMRWRPPDVFHCGYELIDLPVNRLFREMRRSRHFAAMTEQMAAHDVVPMMAARQDIFRWALSKYHGSGSGKKGHLQFKLASGEIERGDIPKVHVHLRKFGRLVDQCRRLHEGKRELAEALLAQGLSVKPLLYEDFLEDKVAFFEDFLESLGHPVRPGQVHSMLEGAINLQRVHTGPLSDYVENAVELERAFGGAWEEWSSDWIGEPPHTVDDHRQEVHPIEGASPDSELVESESLR